MLTSTSPRQRRIEREPRRFGEQALLSDGSLAPEALSALYGRTAPGERVHGSIGRLTCNCVAKSASRWHSFARNLEQIARTRGILKQNVRTLNRDEGSGGMARRKKSSSGGGWAILLFGVLFLISKVPVEIWVSIGVLGVVGFVIYSVSKSGKPSQPSAPPPAQDQSPPQARRSPPLGAPKTVSTNRSVAPAPAPVPAPAIRATVPTPPASGHRPLSPPPSATPASSASSKNDELLSVRPANSGASSTSPVSQRDRDFKLPPAPMGMGAATWIQPSTLVPHAGAVIPGGLFYFGTNLPGLGGSPDPSLVNPSLSVAATGDYAQDQLGYWPSYSQMTPAARRAYINWLVGKRSDPRANIGFVFVFFYGLERRALVDATNDDKALSDLPTIAAEVQRLLNIYGEQSQSFRRYATNLLDWVSVARTDRLYTRPTPTFEQTFELPFHLRLALGQAVRDGAPIPGHLGTVCKTSSAQ